MKSHSSVVVLSLLLSTLSFAEPTTNLEAALELRPTWSSADTSLRMENEAQLAYRFNPTSSMGYVQEFKAKGLGIERGDGYARWEWGFYTLRFYLPKEDRVTSLQNRFYFPWALTGHFALSLTEIPIFHVFSSLLWENRSEWALEMTFLREKLRARLPLIVQNIRNQDRSWEHLVWVSPEVIYSIGEKTGLGVAYNNDGMTPLKEGAIQLVLQQAI